MSKDKFIKGSGNVFKDFGFDEVEAKSLQFRSNLMNIIVRYIQQKGLTQEQAAKCLKTTQPRVSNLVHGKIDLFSADILLDMMERIGFPIYKKLEADTKQFFKKYKHQPYHHVNA